jgi:hypothetical protein
MDTAPYEVNLTGDGQQQQQERSLQQQQQQQQQQRHVSWQLQ